MDVIIKELNIRVLTGVRIEEAKAVLELADVFLRSGLLRIATGKAFQA